MLNSKIIPNFYLHFSTFNIFVSPDINSIVQRLNEKELQLNHMILGFLQARYQKIDNLFIRIRNPNDYLFHVKTQIEGLRNRIYKNITSKIKIDKETLTHIDKNLQRNHPSEYLYNLFDRLCILEKRLNKLNKGNDITSCSRH